MDKSWEELLSVEKSSKLSAFCEPKAIEGAEFGSERDRSRDLLVKDDQLVPVLVGCETGRYFGDKGKPVRVVYVGLGERQDGKCKSHPALPVLKVEQKERRILLAIQLSQIASNLKEKPSLKAMTSPSVCAWAWPDIETKYDLADIDFSVPAFDAQRKTRLSVLFPARQNISF